MSGLTKLARMITTFNVKIARVMSYAVLVLFVLLLSDVIMRYVQQSPISWSAEASKLLFGVYAIIGGGYVMACRAHVNVDLFYCHFSPKKKAVVDIITSTLFFLFLGVLISESFGMAVDSTMRLEVSYETIWRPPVWPSKIMIVVAAILLLLQGVLKFIADWMILFDIPVDETAFGPVPVDDSLGKDIS